MAPAGAFQIPNARGQLHRAGQSRGLKPWVSSTSTTSPSPTAAVEVLHRVDISVEEGEFPRPRFGPSGCGKSTLLNMIAGTGGGSPAARSRSRIAVVNGVPSVQAQHRHGVPVLRALSQHERWARTSPSASRCTGVPKSERDKAMKEVAAPPSDREPARPQARGSFRSGHAAARRPWAAAPLGAQPGRVPLRTSPCRTLTRNCASTCAPRSKKLHQELGTTIVLRDARPNRRPCALDP